MTPGVLKYWSAEVLGALEHKPFLTKEGEREMEVFCKIAGLRPVTLLKRNSGRGVFL